MIVKVKKKNKNLNYIKIALIVLSALLVVVFIYNFQENQKKKIALQKAKEQQELALKLEKQREQREIENAKRVILIEVEKVVELIGQENINNLEILKNKVVYILKPDTNIDAIMVRYGAQALIKRNFNEIVVVVDIEHILRSRLR